MVLDEDPGTGQIYGVYTVGVMVRLSNVTGTRLPVTAHSDTRVKFYTARDAFSGAAPPQHYKHALLLQRRNTLSSFLCSPSARAESCGCECRSSSLCPPVRLSRKSTPPEEPGYEVLRSNRRIRDNKTHQRLVVGIKGMV